MRSVSYTVRGPDGDHHYVDGALVAPKAIAKAIAEELPEPLDDDRDELKAKLKEAGVAFGGNTSTAKLRELVAQL
jgi:hypothetical protein